MISLNVLKSTDSDLIGEFNFHKNLIYIGKDQGDLRNTISKKLLNQHLFIEIYNEKLIAHPHQSLDFFLVNGKRTTGPKFIKIGDIIDLPDLSFKINSFLKTPEINTRDEINKITDHLISEENKILEVIEFIQDED